MKVAIYELVMTKMDLGSSPDPWGAGGTHGPVENHAKVGQMKKFGFQTHPQRCFLVATGDLLLGSTPEAGTF